MQTTTTTDNEILMGLVDHIQHWLDKGRSPDDYMDRLRKYSDADGAVFGKLRDVAYNEGVAIRLGMPAEAPASAKGGYDIEAKRIDLNPAVPTDRLAGVLVHELSHHFTPQIQTVAHVVGRGDMKKGYAAVEFLGEAAAHVVSTHLGIADADYSALYCAGWGSQLIDTPDAFPFLLGGSLATARAFQDALDKGGVLLGEAA